MKNRFLITVLITVIILIHGFFYYSVTGKPSGGAYNFYYKAIVREIISERILVVEITHTHQEILNTPPGEETTKPILSKGDIVTVVFYREDHDNASTVISEHVGVNSIIMFSRPSSAIAKTEHSRTLLTVPAEGIAVFDADGETIIAYYLLAPEDSVNPEVSGGVGRRGEQTSLPGSEKR